VFFFLLGNEIYAIENQEAKREKRLRRGKTKKKYS